MKRYAIYLLDADNTLFDFGKAEKNAFRRTFEALSGRPCTEELYACYSRLNSALWEALERGEITKPQLQQTRFARFLREQGLSGDGDAWNEAYLDRLAEGNFLFDGAEETCRRLSAHAPLYIATNGVTRVQKRRLRESAIAPYVSGIFVSEEAGAEKPSRIYFAHVFRQLGQPPREKVLMVGDSLTSDMTGGRNYGIDTCWYNPKEKPLPGDCAVTWQIARLSDLLVPWESGAE